MNGARRIRSDKLKGYRYIEGNARYLKSKRVELDEGRNDKQMREQV